MNIEKLRQKDLNELFELKNITESACEDYAKNLTTYDTMNSDPMFQSMSTDTQKMYNQRGKLVKMLNVIKQIIEEKLMSIYDE